MPLKVHLYQKTKTPKQNYGYAKKSSAETASEKRKKESTKSERTEEKYLKCSCCENKIVCEHEKQPKGTKENILIKYIGSFWSLLMSVWNICPLKRARRKTEEGERERKRANGTKQPQITGFSYVICEQAKTMSTNQTLISTTINVVFQYTQKQTKHNFLRSEATKTYNSYIIWEKL